MRNSISIVVLCLGFLGLMACDLSNPLEDLEVRIDLEDAEIQIPASAGTVDVRADRPTISSGTATSDSDIARVEDLETIQLEPSFFSYVPSTSASFPMTGARTAAALDGTLRIFLFLGEVPVPETPITLTVQDGVVTAVEPQVIEVEEATMNAAEVASFLESLPAESLPQLADWETMTIDEVVTEINAALSSGSIPFAIGVEATGGLDGSVRLDQLEFDAAVVISS